MTFGRECLYSISVPVDSDLIVGIIAGSSSVLRNQLTAKYLRITSDGWVSYSHGPDSILSMPSTMKEKDYIIEGRIGALFLLHSLNNP